MTKQQEKMDELLEFLRYRLTDGDMIKARILLDDMVCYLKFDVMAYIKELMLNDLDERGKKLFRGLVED